MKHGKFIEMVAESGETCEKHKFVGGTGCIFFIDSYIQEQRANEKYMNEIHPDIITFFQESYIGFVTLVYHDNNTKNK
jgi:hypothetical protein